MMYLIVLEILTPFEEATDFVQVDCVPLADYVISCVKRLSKYNSPFVSALKSSLEKRMPYYKQNRTYVFALASKFVGAVTTWKKRMA